MRTSRRYCNGANRRSWPKNSCGPKRPAESSTPTRIVIYASAVHDGDAQERRHAGLSESFIKRRVGADRIRSANSTAAILLPLSLFILVRPGRSPR